MEVQGLFVIIPIVLILFFLILFLLIFFLCRRFNSNKTTTYTNSSYVHDGISTFSVQQSQQSNVEHQNLFSHPNQPFGSPNPQKTISINHHHHKNLHHDRQLPSSPPPYSENNVHFTSSSGNPYNNIQNFSGQIPTSSNFQTQFNRSVSDFSEFPSMTDILFSSSKTSIPVALHSESNKKKKSKFSDSARGDSIESKRISKDQNPPPYTYDNPRFSYSSEEGDSQARQGNDLNERLSSNLESDEETIEQNDRYISSRSNWLDSLNEETKKKINYNQLNETHSRRSKKKKNSKKKRSISAAPPESSTSTTSRSRSSNQTSPRPLTSNERTCEKEYVKKKSNSKNKKLKYRTPSHSHSESPQNLRSKSLSFDSGLYESSVTDFKPKPNRKTQVGSLSRQTNV